MVNKAKTLLRSYTLNSRDDAVALVFHSMIIAQIWDRICYVIEMKMILILYIIKNMDKD